MQTTIERAKSFTDLLRMREEGPYLYTHMFSDEGRKERSRSKRAFKLLKKIDGPLRDMLRDGERVLFVTSGVTQPSIIEWYFLGWALYAMNRRAIVVTDQRIILLQIGSRNAPREFRNQIAYSSVAGVTKNLWGSLKVAFRNGDTASLQGIPRAERALLRDIFAKGLGALDATPTQDGIEDLCPRCYAPASGEPSSCPACGQAFKSAGRAGLLSLVFPGAGDLYLGHRFFAAMEIVAATLIWASFALIAFDPYTGLRELLIGAGILALFMHGFDALATRRIARKGLAAERRPPGPWQFGAAAVVPVATIAVMLVAASSKSVLAPEPIALTASQIAPDHLDALRDAGYVEPDETVHYFFSYGITSVLQDGNFFTDDRVVSYETTPDSTFYMDAPFDQVSAIRTRFATDPGALSSLYVARSDGAVFYLIVSPEGGGDRAFADALMARWREVRSAAPGVWFEGGEGSSVDDAVLVHGAVGGDEAEEAEHDWLAAWLGQEGPDWTFDGRREEATDGDVIDYVTVGYPDGASEDYVFRRASR